MTEKDVHVNKQFIVSPTLSTLSGCMVAPLAPVKFTLARIHENYCGSGKWVVVVMVKYTAFHQLSQIFFDSLWSHLKTAELNNFKPKCLLTCVLSYFE